MSKRVLIAVIVFVFGAQSANAACKPSSTKPTNEELAKLVICLQGEIDKVPTSSTDANAIHKKDSVFLRFPDVNWCIARGDPNDNKAYTIQCSASPPPGGVAVMKIDTAP